MKFDFMLLNLTNNIAHLRIRNFQPTSICWIELTSGQKSGQNTVKEWSEHRIKVIFELSNLVNSLSPIMGSNTSMSYRLQ